MFITNGINFIYHLPTFLKCSILYIQGNTRTVPVITEGKIAIVRIVSLKYHTTGTLV